MKVARYWVRESLQEPDPRGGTVDTVAWGWSSDNAEQARGRARESAKRLAKWLLNTENTEHLSRSQEYAYFCDRPPREEIIQEFHDHEGDPTAVITRNSYGSLVLNTRELMFVDVDLPRSSRGTTLGRIVGSLFGKRYTEPSEALLHQIREWASTRRDLTTRLYRTAAGFRAMIIDRPTNALSDLAKQILIELDSDPLYRRLCESQECFRARLTPKPWRIAVENPPARFPFPDDATESQYRQWQAEYDREQSAFATCQFIAQFGKGQPHADLEPFVKLHDEMTRCESGRPLA